MARTTRHSGIAAHADPTPPLVPLATTRGRRRRPPDVVPCIAALASLAMASAQGARVRVDCALGEDLAWRDRTRAGELRAVRLCAALVRAALCRPQVDGSSSSRWTCCWLTTSRRSPDRACAPERMAVREATEAADGCGISSASVRHARADGRWRCDWRGCVARPRGRRGPADTAEQAGPPSAPPRPMRVLRARFVAF